MMAVMPNNTITAIQAPVPLEKSSRSQSQRQAMVATAARWLPQRGMAAVNLIEVARAVNAPRGSMYHYFPGGRDQLLQEALALGSKSGLRMINKAAEAASTPQEFIRNIFRTGARQLNGDAFSGGCPVGAAVLSCETQDAAFKLELQQSFAQWEVAIAQALTTLGITSKSQAKTLARCTLIAYEGALMCAKGTRDDKVFKTASCMVESMLDASTQVR